VLEICSYFRSIPMLIPESASVDMIEISIPPTSITHSIPSDITIVTALFFSISISDLGVRNDGLIAVMITPVWIGKICLLMVMSIHHFIMLKKVEIINE